MQLRDAANEAARDLLIGQGGPGQTAVLTLPSMSISSSGYPATFPIFITEWNWAQTKSEEQTTYIGKSLISFSRQPGLKGTDIYTLLPTDVGVAPYEDCGGCIIGPEGAYSVSSDNKYTLAGQRRDRVTGEQLSLRLANPFQPTISASTPRMKWFCSAPQEAWRLGG